MAGCFVAGAGEAASPAGERSARLATSSQGPVLLPGIARQRGQNATTWRSEVTMMNPLGAAAGLLLEIIPRDEVAPVAQKTFDLDPGEVVHVADVYNEMGLSAGGGTLRVTGPAVTWVRTYNQGAAGTFGQDVVEAVGTAVPAGERFVFPVFTPANLQTDFRSNFLAVNLETTPCDLTLRIGSRSTTITVPGNTHVQQNLVGHLLFAQPGLGALEVTGTGRWAGTVSTIDPVTGDPTTVRGWRLAVAGGAALFAGVASQGGKNNTKWRSEVVLYNFGAASESVVLEIVPRGATAVTATRTLVVEPGELRLIADVYAELGAGSGVGLLRVAGRVMPWVRTYNQGSAGTFGQDVPPVTDTVFPANHAMLFPFERPATLVSGFRSNLLLLNHSSGELNVTLSGGGMGRTTTVSRGTYVQLNDIGEFLDTPDGIGILSVTANGPWSGYISTVDPSTGDPTTIRGIPAP